MIDVVFCVDAAFWQPLLVTISSLLSQNPASRFRLFVISSTDVPDVEQTRLSGIVAASGNATSQIILFKDSTAYGHLPVHGHLSVATYLRLFVTELLPADVEKVLYLDSDVLIRSNRIEELWQKELGEAYLGAALEPFDARQRLPLGFGPNDFYFNAGVLLLNVRKWREDDVVPQLLSFAERNRAILYSPDQDILNSVFRGKVIDIGIQWNWQALFVRLTPAQLRITSQEFAQCKRAPRIIHFTSRYKPWSWKWAPHYQSLYVAYMQNLSWPQQDKNAKFLRTKIRRIMQRGFEWFLPGMARSLREKRLHPQQSS